MSKLISTLAVAGLLLACQPAQALTKKQVFAWTKSLATISGAVAYMMACPGEFFPRYKGEAKNIQFPFTRQSSLGGGTTSFHFRSGFGTPLVVGAATWVGVHTFFSWILSKYTPDARYEWASNELKDFERKYLFNQRITNENIAQVLQEAGCEASELPLVSAFLELQYCDNRLTYMADQLSFGMKDEGYTSLSKRMNDLRVTIIEHLKHVRASEATIKGQVQWLEQWKIHQQRVLEREKMYATQTHVVWNI